MNKVENRITFKIKVLTHGTMTLLRSTISKIEKDENMPYLEITEVVFRHRKVAYNSYQQNC